MPQQSGFTAQTAERLLLDSGAFYRDYDPATQLGTLIGATRGGGEFNAKPNIRAIQVDGVKGAAKGLEVIDSWDVTIMTNLLELTAASLALALASGNVDAASNPNFDIVTADNAIAIDDYVGNITWVGRLSGSNNPVMIQIYNALATEGIKLTTKDADEGVIPVTFKAHYDATDLDTVPFKIYYPKIVSDTAAPTVTVTPLDAAAAVAVGTNIVWTFSEAIQPASVNPANFFLTKASDGSLVPGSLTLNAAGTVVTLDPTTNMTAATAYIAVATQNVKDMNGNALAANSITNFTTA